MKLLMENAEENLGQREEAMQPLPRTIAERSIQKIVFVATQCKRLLEMDEIVQRRADSDVALSKGNLVTKESKFGNQLG